MCCIVGEAATHDWQPSELRKEDLARMERGEPMPQLDFTRYENATSAKLSSKAKAADIDAHAHASALAAAYDTARVDALELTRRYGVSGWQQQLAALEELLASEKEALRASQRAIEQINADRKAAQLRAGERLYAADREFYALSAKNVELNRVTKQLQAEIDELKTIQE